MLYAKPPIEITYGTSSDGSVYVKIKVSHVAIIISGKLNFESSPKD